MEKNVGDTCEDLSSSSLSDASSSKTDVTAVLQETDVNTVSQESEVVSEEQPAVEPVDTWLLGGPIGTRSSTLIFRSSALANVSELSIREKPAHKLHVTYKVLQAETKLLSRLLDCHGITETANNSNDFNLLWTGSHPKPGVLRALAPFQRVNHFPRSYELTRKDRLYKNIERMQHVKGYKHFDFIPQTFVMPLEYAELCSMHHRVKGPWIVKPVASSRGRGIYIVETPNQVPLEEPVVVAKYISKPLLVEGHKCDLRLYVAVTSFDPLLIYIYEEGLVRFATVKYDASHKQLWNPCMHLCNYSINKYHSDYVKSDDPSAENVGHKWTLSALLRHLKTQGRDTALLMSQVEDLVIKSVLASANSIIVACRMFVPNPNNCFELYGFDILIDENLKPWLLEVNLSPSLGCDSPLDVRLKSAMLADLLTLVGVPAVDPILRPSTTTLDVRSSQSVKMNLGNCRHVRSSDGLSNVSGKKKPLSRNKDRLTSSALTLTPEESRMIKNAKQQFERRGGFVRIFPAVDSWSKYSQYLDQTSGIPLSGGQDSGINLSTRHNFNLLLYQHLFPTISTSTKIAGDRSPTRPDSTSPTSHSSNKQKGVGTQVARQDRYERMLIQGHKAALTPRRPIKDSESIELHRQVAEMLKNGKKLTQSELRKTFSQYLVLMLRSVTNNPDEENHAELVLKFLQKASQFLKAPFYVKAPSHCLEAKDRAAIIAKQLNDFLYMYNRETDLFVEKDSRPTQIPPKLYAEYLEGAGITELEGILVRQTLLNVPETGGGLQGVTKYVPGQLRACGGARPASRPPCRPSKGVRVSPLS